MRCAAFIATLAGVAAFAAAGPTRLEAAMPAALEPCLIQHDGTEELVDRFEADGWVPLEPAEARKTAARAVGEVQTATAWPTPAFENSRDQQTFVRAQVYPGERLAEAAPFLKRGEDVLHIAYAPAQMGPLAVCILIGEELAIVERLLATGSEPSAPGLSFERRYLQPDAPDGVRAITVQAVRMNFPFETDPAPASSDALILTVSYGAKQ